MLGLPAPIKGLRIVPHRPLVLLTTTMCPKRRPPRPKHPKFTHFHRSGLRFGRFPAQRRSIGGVGGRRKDRRAWLWCPWAAGPGCGARGRQGLAGLRDDAPSHTSATRPRRCGGRRKDRRAWLRRPWAVAGPGRASRSTTPSRRLACGDLAGGPPPTGASSSPAPQQDPTAPGTPVAPDNDYYSETSPATTSPRGSRRDRPR